MIRSMIGRWLRVAALAATVPLALASVAWGQEGRYDNDDNYYRHDEAREHGYKSGYRDGLNKGQYDSERGRRFNFKNDDWEDSRGFEGWMGSKGRYKQAYREGYERGYRRAYGDRYRDRDDYRGRDRDDWR
jgi:hypothetical protein